MTACRITGRSVGKEDPAAAFAASAVKVGMKEINGTWLIASFDPV